MSLWESLAMLNGMQMFHKRYDSDYIDRMNHRYTMHIFLILGLVTGITEFIDSSIHCWAPAQFPHEWVYYTNRICWISNTYYVPFDERIPSKDDNGKYYIAYYQWVPLILFLQATLFIVPDRIWKIMHGRSGIHLHNLNQELRDAEHAQIGKRKRVIHLAADVLHRGLMSQQEYKSDCITAALHKITGYGCCIICGRRFGNYLSTLYLFVKILYICNSVGQLFLLNSFLGDGYYLYGYERAKELVTTDNPWRTSYRFPLVTLCDFQIRSLGNRIHNHTVQCVLPKNLFHEMIYVFAWFWLVFLSFVNIINTISWMATVFSLTRYEYVRKRLMIMEKNYGKRGSRPSKAFCNDYLGQDGVFVLQLISENTSSVVSGELLHRIWVQYKEQSCRACFKNLTFKSTNEESKLGVDV